MEKDKEILSEITVWMKYAKYLPKKERRETWKELVSRNREMHFKTFKSYGKEFRKEIIKAYKHVYDKRVLPSMRSMQFAGKPIEVAPNRIYNCAYLPIDHEASFSETMFLLLGGTGVGYSVQKHHVDCLPRIRKPDTGEERRYVIGDSIEGWADAVKVLIKSYYHAGDRIKFDYSDIRPKGAALITSGGKAPGPSGLRECLVKIENLLRETEDGTKLKPIQVHDIICYIADAVLAGGIRRAALISLFSVDDAEMVSSKTGNWWELNPQRGRANNSAVLIRHRLTESVFRDLWKRVEASGSGEPGIYLSNDKDWGTNPCCEIALRPYQFCNLCEVNVSDVTDQEDYEERVRAAAFIGTLQAAYTDFHYLRPIWKKTTEKDALIGVSMTGIGSAAVLSMDLKAAAKVVKTENARVAQILGIRRAARSTTVKPAGTTSLTLGTSSGIHAWHNEHYIRRIRVGKNESIYPYLKIYHPEMVEDEFFRPDDQAVISVPQRAPEGSILRSESPLQTLERVKLVARDWVQPGHNSGNNTHNVSCTISVRDHEWDAVGNWMWTNREFYNGISVLPYNGGTYKQAPFEDCSKEDYEQLFETLQEVDLTKVVELTDETSHTDEVACGGGGCEVT